MQASLLLPREEFFLVKNTGIIGHTSSSSSFKHLTPNPIPHTNPAPVTGIVPLDTNPQSVLCPL